MKKRSQVNRSAISNRDVIAERRLDLVTSRGARAITVRFMRPELEARPAGVWICVYEIQGLPRRRAFVRAAPGVDGVQALIGALQSARQDLRVLQEDGLRLSLEGQSDLGFPALFEGEATTAQWRREKLRAPRLSKYPTYGLGSQ
jgi:hypothetical protein